MRPWHFAWLLAGLMGGLGSSAKTANMGIWDIDSTCLKHVDPTTKKITDETARLQKAFNGALDLVIAGQESLKYVLDKRPDKKKKDKYIKWIRIADSVAAVFGFVPNPLKTEKATDPHWKTVFTLFDKVTKTLQAKKNDPANGYSKTLQKALPNHKPLLICGDTWQWLGLESKVPKTDKTLGNLDEEKTEAGYQGAWYKEHRFIWTKEIEEKPIRCGPRTLGHADLPLDMITLCDILITDAEKALPLPAELKAGKMVKAGASLDEYRDSIVATVLHELFHWFGGFEGGDTSKGPAIIDQLVVDKRGRIVYEDKEGKRVTSNSVLWEGEIKFKGWRHIFTYSRHDVWNLARVHRGYLEHYSGPNLATKNAESLNQFCLMMYFDDWMWAYKGIARVPAPMYGDTEDSGGEDYPDGDDSDDDD